MTQRIVTRGNTTFMSFTFYDENGDLAVCDSAEVQLSYPGSVGYETELVALTDASNVWSGEWVSTHSRPGWVEYHAVGTNVSGSFASDGRFRLAGNRANLDHDALPTAGTVSDYELVPRP